MLKYKCENENKKMSKKTTIIIALALIATLAIVIAAALKFKNTTFLLDDDQTKKNQTIINQGSEKNYETSFVEPKKQIAKFENMTAYSTERDNGSYVLLIKDGKEIIIDQNKKENYFYNPKFSPNGTYLTYMAVTGMSTSILNIYDIKENKKITEYITDDSLKSINNFDFTPDEKYFYLCSGSEMGPSYPGGKIYSIPDFKTEYDVLRDPRSENFIIIDCSYDKNSNIVSFVLSDFSVLALKKNENANKSVTIKYNLNSKKAQ